MYLAAFVTADAPRPLMPRELSLLSCQRGWGLWFVRVGVCVCVTLGGVDGVGGWHRMTTAAWASLGLGVESEGWHR